MLKYRVELEAKSSSLSELLLDNSTFKHISPIQPMVKFNDLLVVKSLQGLGMDRGDVIQTPV